MGDRKDGDLERRIQERLPVSPIRPRAQIPQAEAEADRLSANVRASSPEGVKADLGRRMGADFSGIRFHTGSAAAARANSMGARAFTSGADVYFGEGGFDASVAAHELVHTAQQGVVSGETSVSVPVGTVQREPLSLGRIKRAYKKDEDYMFLRKLMDAYNKEEDPRTKVRLEQLIMTRAANYVDKFSTGDKPIHKGRTKDAESLIYQLSANKDMQEKAQENLTNLDASVDQADVPDSTQKREAELDEAARKKIEDEADPGKRAKLEKDLADQQELRGLRLQYGRSTMHDVIGETKSGIATGEVGGTKLSPALRAILTETMATQSSDVQMGMSASGGQYTGASMSGDRGPSIQIGVMGAGLNLGRMKKDGFSDELIQNTQADETRNLVPSLFHEATHGHADQVYGSVVTMAKDDIQDPDMVKKEESERMTRAKELQGIAGDDQTKQIKSVSGKVAYAQDGGITAGSESYYDRADKGYRADNQDFTALKTLNTSREAAGLAKEQFPGMIEYDPSINEALMNFELSGGDKDSLIYRKLKAAALVSHAKRHNANLEGNLPPRRV